MTIQLSSNSFLQMLGQSGLLTVRQRESVMRHVGTKPGLTASEICDWLVEEDLITRWQGEKLLQARYRGFFLGHYRLLDRIARGGMSTIYSARHGVTNEVHALKVLPPARTAKASYLPRFRREAEMTQRLIHPNIVRVFGVHEASDGQNPVHFMAMELLKGRDLFEIVNHQGPLSIYDAVNFIRQAALGLHCAHEHGLVHRDVKPGNLFLTSDRVIRILDLGLAQDFDSDENLTRDFNDKVLGTADYLAPEQATDSHDVDARADLYSLGCTLYFLLTGRPPFTEGTLVQRLVAHQTRSPSPLSNYRSDVPDSLNSLLLRMMARNRADRVASAEGVAEELSRIQLELAEAGTSYSREVLEPEANLQHHVETATGTSDDSWPDELWQAIAGSLAPTDPSASAVEIDDRKAPDSPDDLERPLNDEPQLEVDRIPLIPAFAYAEENVSEGQMTAAADQMFQDFLTEIEARCAEEKGWDSRSDAQELLQIVRRLRIPSSSGTATLIRKELGFPEPTKSGVSWAAVFLLLAALFAVLALTVSQL